MESSDLEKQVAAERQEIENAPQIPVSQLQPRTSGMAGFCHWCRRFSTNLVYVETVHEVERYKGAECCGARHQ